MTFAEEEFAEFTFHDLRAMAVFLQRKPTRHVTKEELITELAAHWRSPAHIQHSVAQLSPAAQRALWWLCHSTAVPAQPFWYEFGAVRRARERQQGEPAPWQQPATASEELYYTGLLHAYRATQPGTTAPALAPTLNRADHLMLPTPLRQPLMGLVAAAQPQPTPVAEMCALSQPTISAPHLLLHDLGQYLIYLHQSEIQHAAPLTLLHSRWFAPRHLRAVADRLLCAQARHTLRSHKSNSWLRLLAFLATTAGLQADGRLTAQGWAWLAHPPATQLALLWHGWQQSEWPVRDAYAQPDASLPLPWPSLLTAALAAVASPFTPAHLAAQLLSGTTITTTYWNQYLESLQHFVERLAALCATFLTPLGIVAPTTPPTSLPPTSPATSTHPNLTYYTLTSFGATLVQPNAGATGTIPPITHSPANLTITETHSPITITITFPAPSPCPAVSPTLHAQAIIAGFADDGGIAGFADDGGQEAGAHRYQITAATLARAAARDLGLPALFAALQAVAIPLSPPLWELLQSGYDQAQQWQLQPATLLRANDAAQLAALHQQRPLAALVAEILTPTTALLGVDPATALTTLQEHGYVARSPYRQDSAPSPSATTSTPLELQQPAREALWLAGQLYALLAAHLPLPLPPLAAPLQALYATLPAATQATLAAQKETMAEQLHTLLDNLPFTPPLEPSDPAVWIPLIDRALDTGQRLQLRYFSAGRNLTTQRLVDPYWREEHRDVPYLRGYCHSAGRVLTFRLDRIEALDVVSVDD